MRCSRPIAFRLCRTDSSLPSSSPALRASALGLDLTATKARTASAPAAHSSSIAAAPGVRDHAPIWFGCAEAEYCPAYSSCSGWPTRRGFSSSGLARNSADAVAIFSGSQRSRRTYLIAAGRGACAALDPPTAHQGFSAYQEDGGSRGQLRRGTDLSSLCGRCGPGYRPGVAAAIHHGREHTA